MLRAEVNRGGNLPVGAQSQVGRIVSPVAIEQADVRIRDRAIVQVSRLLEERCILLSRLALRRDGAAAAVLCSIDKAKQRTTKPIKIAGCALATCQFGDPRLADSKMVTHIKPGVPRFSEAVGAVNKVYQQTGIGPEDVDFIELQDNSTLNELAFPELFGLCKPGESDYLVDHDETGIGGRLPINPSGGFQSFGEATTAMGLFQLAHVFWQLNGESGARQVENAKVGLAQSMGLHGNGAAVMLTK